ncbi:alpha/beta fold hydrolase [Flammeovirgaceae bacterium SG7u.111]|nr:alpha/beta fold hydrolase [Flammeovirgaceae bacterium SG7u.132]WPO36358.1 alpha/beta fold hydrolase [Flammeovirgaceae bacterium SG7u.111]
MKKKLLIFSTLCLFIGLFLADYLGPRAIIQTHGGVYSLLRPKKSKGLPKAEDYGLKSEKLEIQSQDGLNLSTLLIRTDSPVQKGTVIFVHGIRAYKERFFPACQFLSAQGYNSVLIDLRAHGGSEGEFCTFGFKEKEDIKTLVDSLTKIDGLSRHIGIWGQSLGAAVSLQAMAVDQRIRFGIIESTFSSFRQIVYDYADYHLGLKAPWLCDYLIWRAESIGDFEADKTVPSLAAKSITQPVLVVHGIEDRRISIAYGRQNFENLKSEKKEFLEIPKAGHMNVWKVGGDEYFEEVLRFVEREL